MFLCFGTCVVIKNMNLITALLIVGLIGWNIYRLFNPPKWPHGHWKWKK